MYEDNLTFKKSIPTRNKDPTESQREAKKDQP